MKTIDYQDANGFFRRVRVPEDFFGDPKEGIPVSLDLRQLFGDAPTAFVCRLSNELFQQGLVEPSDFLAPGSIHKIRASLLSAVDNDSFSIQAFAKGSKS